MIIIIKEELKVIILILPVYSLIVHLIEQEHTELVDYMIQTLHFTKHIIQTYTQYNKAIKKGWEYFTGCFYFVNGNM